MPSSISKLGQLEEVSNCCFPAGSWAPAKERHHSASDHTVAPGLCRRGEVFADTRLLTAHELPVQHRDDSIDTLPLQ
eukprot:6390849-Lingulodinium_polyedra.AAC.1